MAPKAAAAAAKKLGVKKTDADPLAVNFIVKEKVGKQCKQIIEKRKINEHPVELKPHEVLPHPYNRNGQHINIMYIHQDLKTNMDRDGLDPERLQPGIVIKYKDPAKIKWLQDYSYNMMGGQPQLWPPVEQSKAVHGSVATSHVTVKLRLHEAKVKCDQTGVDFVLCADPTDPKYDEDLWKKAHGPGHTYWVLGEDTTEEEAKLLSSWRNADQNQNNGNSEASLISDVREVIRQLLTKAKVAGKEMKTVPIGQVVMMVEQNAIIKIKPSAVGSYRSVSNRPPLGRLF